MSTPQLVILILAVVALVAVLAARGGGPRITTIETKREREKDSDDA